MVWEDVEGSSGGSQGLVVFALLVNGLVRMRLVWAPLLELQGG